MVMSSRTSAAPSKFTIPEWVKSPEEMLEYKIMRLRSRVNSLAQQRANFRAAGLHPDDVARDPRVRALRERWKLTTPVKIDIVECGYPEHPQTNVEDVVRCIREGKAIDMPKVGTLRCERVSIGNADFGMRPLCRVLRAIPS